MSTSLTILLLSSSPANSNRALIARPDRLSKIMSDTRPSEGPNTRLAPAVPTHPDPRLNTHVLSLPAPASLKLSPVQVKQEEIPISLQTLRQSQSLKRVGQSQPPPPPPGHPPSPPPPIMSSPASPPDKETLKHLLPLCYDGKTVIECNRFISQLLIYWAVNTTLSTIKLKIQVALSLLDDDARTWATPIFAQLAAVQIKIQGAKTPFADEAAFLTVFKAHFGNLDDTAAAQVELTKLCTDKSLHEKRTTAEFSALFKGSVDHSGYGDLELCDK
ncbi:predicted protein [Postia placenta Mad-698-R]|nr:predicted protein [Postia placenta Mad-698-R]